MASASGKQLKACPPPVLETRLAGDPLVRIFEAIRDQSVLANPHAFAGTVEAFHEELDITPGTPEAAFQNKENVPVVVTLEAEGDPGGQPGWILVATSKGQCTQQSCHRADYGPAPKVSIVLAPNETAYVDVTDPAGLVTVAVKMAAMKLHGHIGEF